MFGIAKSWSNPGNTRVAWIPRRNPRCCNPHRRRPSPGKARAAGNHQGVGLLQPHTLSLPLHQSQK